MLESRVGNNYQLTLPAEMCEALGIKPGDGVACSVVGDVLHVSPVRPQIDEMLDEVLSDFGFHALQDATGNDAVAYLRKQRGLDGE